MNEELKEYTCTITLRYSGNQHEATNENDYKKKVKEQFSEDYNIDLDDSEITNIKESQ
jgi:hypothetical protein